MEYYGGCGFVVNDFHYIWESFPLYPLCWEFSLRMDMSFITCFSCICWDDHVAFVFSFVNVVYLALTDLHMLDHPVTLGCIRLGHGVWVFIGGVAFGLLVFCWGFLHLYIHQRYWLVIVFFVNCLCLVWYQEVGGFLEWLWKYSLLFSVLEEFEKDQYKFFFLYIW